MSHVCKSIAPAVDTDAAHFRSQSAVAAGYPTRADLDPLYPVCAGFGRVANGRACFPAVSSVRPLATREIHRVFASGQAVVGRTRNVIPKLLYLIGENEIFTPQAKNRHINEAAQQLAIVVNDPDFVSKKVCLGARCSIVFGMLIDWLRTHGCNPPPNPHRGSQSTSCGWNCATSFRSIRRRSVGWWVRRLVD